jgi:transmembrane sensor
MTLPAKDIEETAARYLLNREEPGWGDADEAALGQWLDEDPAHKVAFWRLEHGWAMTGRLAALRPAARTSPARRLPAARWRPMAIAASLAALAVAVVVALGAPALRPASYHTAVGGRETVPLRDGSRVELNTDTRIRTAIDGHRRRVWLERGEAYFEVAHDAARPFVVDAGTRKVTVLGTRFSVRREGDRVTVAVVEGRVRVDPEGVAAEGAPRIITGGDMAIAQGPSILVAPRSGEKVARELSWRRGMLTFDQATLAEAAAEFNRYNTKTLVIADPVAAQIRVGGAFEADNVQAFARLLHSAYGLQVSETDDEVKISR